MSSSYVDGKVREAIQAAKGSRAAAQKILMGWAVEDPDLLRGIAQPFLKAIAAAAIERAGRPAARAPSDRPAARPAAGGGAGRASGLSREALESLLDRMGRDPDEASPAAGRAPDPRPRPAAVSAPPPDGVSHEKSMMAIAKAFAAKKVR
ncbi:hypothetical protein [Azospirillum thermophilum]|uniref:Uncharacterized protein n=1 Tax=Azospirillum thermophilum TaxID=2202148 RepID=A0A2S2CJY9_9PROT|nr:hypothetical protein [Azospirillum thermophilum]AWK84801.1 hypothetical protein DEW08_00085 [Azospirillum thermophilum]